MSRRNRKRRHRNEYIDHEEQKRERDYNIKAKFPTPKNDTQKYYNRLLSDWSRTIILALGPAGTGKTYLAVHHAIQALQNKDIEKIVITRPAVTVEEDHGFLPGSIVDKMMPWMKPIIDVLTEYWSPKHVQYMMENEIVEIAPLAYMRGRTFKNAWIIADEMQNSTPEQMKMVLTRIGDNSRMTITGDLDQHDRGYENNGLADFVWKVGKPQDKVVTKVEFEYRDIERHPAVSRVLNIYGDDYVEDAQDKVIKIS